MDTQIKSKRSWPLTALVAIGLGAIGSILATIIWESEIFAPWHTSNPVNMLLGWLGSEIIIFRVVFLGLVAWSIASLLYVLFQLRQVVIHSASWYADAQHKMDVTDYFKGKAAKRELRIRAETNTLGEPLFGTPKTLTIDYSVWGRRRVKTINEHNEIILDCRDHDA